jgi:hypothetical protein
MQTFVQFIEQRKITDTYLSVKFTVLALYAEYVAWLANQPREDKVAEGRFSASELLIQLELINKYQIHLLKTQNNERPITLIPVPPVITNPNMNYLDQRPTAVDLPLQTELPSPLFTGIQQVKRSVARKPPRALIIGLMILAAALAAGGFFLIYSGIVLPLAASLFINPLTWVAGVSVIRGVADLFRLNPTGHLTNTTIAIWGVIGIAATLTTLFLPTLVPLTSGIATLLELASFVGIFLVADQVIGKNRLALINATKAAAESETIMSILNTLDQPNLPQTSLSEWKQPLMNKLKDGCEQPENKLEEAVTATTHCLLVSRFTEQGDDTLSIDDLNQNLQMRLKTQPY